MNHISANLTIPDRLFAVRPHLVSRDKAAVRYICNVCGIVEPHAVANGYIRRPCACEEKARAIAERAARMEASHQEIVQRKAAKTYTWLGRDMQETGLENKTFANFDKKHQKKAYAKAYWFASQIVQGQHAGNLLLCGSYGTGKTHMAAAILNTLRENGIGCLFCTVQNLFTALYAASFEEKQVIVNQASSTPLLVLDDLDKLHIAVKREDKEQEGAYQKLTLFEIVDKRYKRRLPTIITTNEQSDFSRWLDKAAQDRFFGLMEEPVEMNGVSYRTIQGRA